MITLTHEHNNRQFIARIGEPFTVLTFDPERDAGWCRLHPHLERLPGGRLILTANIHGDIEGAELLSYASDDEGQTWYSYPEWPNAGWSYNVLDGQRCLAVSNGGFYETSETGVYHWGIRRSDDGGLTWSPIETVHVELDLQMDDPGGAEPVAADV